MRGVTPRAAAYRKELDAVLAEFGGRAGFEAALADDADLGGVLADKRVGLGERERGKITDAQLLQSLEGTAEGQLPASPRPSPRPSPGPLTRELTLDEQLIDQLRLQDTIDLAQKRVEARAQETPRANEPAPITDADLLASISGTRPRNPPGVFSAAARGVGRIATAGAQGFSEAFGPDPITGPAALAAGAPSLGALEPLVTGPAQATSALIQTGEAALRGIPASFHAATRAFEQALKEVGVGDTKAKKVANGFLELFEAGAIVTGTRPVLLPGVIEGARRGGRFLMSTNVKEAKEAVLNAQKAERARFKAINEARAEIRRLAKPGTSEAEIRTQAFELELRRLDDALVKADGEEALNLHAPDEIITSTPTLRAMRLPIEIQERAIKVAQDILVARGVPPNSLTPRRVQQLVAGLLETDDAFSIRLFADIEAAGMNKTDFIQAFLATGSEAGRTLQARTRFFGEDPVLTAFRELARTDDDVAEAVRQVIDGTDELGNRLIPGSRLTGMDLGESTFVTASRAWRSALISLPTTAVRNLIDSGGFRTLLDAHNQMIDQVFRRMFHPGSPDLEPIGKSFEILAQSFSGLIRDVPKAFAGKVTGGRVSLPIKPSKSKRMLDTLIRMFPEIRGNTFANIELDIAMRAGVRVKGPLRGVDKFVNNWLLAMNRTQEFIVRRSSLASRLDAGLKKIGSSLEDVVDNGIIPAGFNQALKTASDETLLLTFAMSPKQTEPLGRLFSAYAKLIEGSKVLVVMEPFPRFIFNATKLIMENTATAGLRLMRTSNRAKLATGDFSPLAKELTGTAMLATAYAIRQGDFPGITPGARFDEVIGPEGIRVSMAPFATIIPHLFLADLIIRIEEGRFQGGAGFDVFREFRRGMLSSAPQVGRLSDGIKDAFEALGGIDSNASFDKFIEFMGESVGAGAFRPVQLIKDFRGEWNDAVTVQRETRGQGGLAAIRNLIDPEGLPERESPTRAASPAQPRVRLPGNLGTVSGPLFSQVSGAPVREPRNPVEKALVVQGFRGGALSPKTGNKKADALILRFSGPLLELVGNFIVQGDVYRNLPNKARQEVLRNLITLTRAPAIAIAKKLAPTVFAAIKLKRLPAIKLRAMEQSVDLILKSQGLDVTMADFMRRLEERGLQELETQGLTGTEGQKQ